VNEEKLILSSSNKISYSCLIVWVCSSVRHTRRHAKFHLNPCTGLWVILLTDRQTNIAGNRRSHLPPSLLEVIINTTVRLCRPKLIHQLLVWKACASPPPKKKIYIWSIKLIIQAVVCKSLNYDETASRCNIQSFMYTSGTCCLLSAYVLCCWVSMSAMCRSCINWQG